MKRSLIVVNLKTYQHGARALKLCRKIEKVNKDIVVGCTASDLYRVSRGTKLSVYCQHVESMKKGRNTGFVLPEAAKENGAVGVMLNHSEHPLEWIALRLSILRCQNLKLKTMVFAKDFNEAKRLEKLKVDYVVIEPPELVGGKVSVSEARPELIKRIGRGLKVKFLVGAGVHNKEDINIAMKYGASGVALSSAVTTSKNPEKVLRELMR